MRGRSDEKVFQEHLYYLTEVQIDSDFMPKPPEPEIGTSLIKAIANTDSTDALAELGDIGIDRFLEDSFLNGIPALGFLLKFVRTGRDIRDWNFTRKIVKFLQSTAQFTPEERLQFIEKLESDPNFARDTGERLIILIDRLDELDKIPLLAKLFRAYINDRIDLALFRRLASALDRAFIDDLNSLLELDRYSGKQAFFKQLLLSGLTEISDRSRVSNPRKDREKSRRMGVPAPVPFGISNPLNSSDDDDYAYLGLEISELGQLFVEIMNETF